jgi:hypothetical protein
MFLNAAGDGSYSFIVRASRHPIGVKKSRKISA